MMKPLDALRWAVEYADYEGRFDIPERDAALAWLDAFEKHAPAILFAVSERDAILRGIYGESADALHAARQWLEATTKEDR
jgi:hypothetical protein